MSPVGKRLPFCAFNGGNDVFVDIGDKSWGVLACQQFFGGIGGGNTLHVGDQFLSAGANDFKVTQRHCSCNLTALTRSMTGEARMHNGVDREPGGDSAVAR